MVAQQFRGLGLLLLWRFLFLLAGSHEISLVD